jgi:hypothetical protein
MDYRFWRSVGAPNPPRSPLRRSLIFGSIHRKRDLSHSAARGLGRCVALVEAAGAVSLQIVTGVLGDLGSAIAAEKLPFYEYDDGSRWHFVWNWDSNTRLFSMAPETAQRLGNVGA